MAFYTMNIDPLGDPAAMTSHVHKQDTAAWRITPAPLPETSWSSREKGDKPEDDLRVCVKSGSLRPA